MKELIVDSKINHVNQGILNRNIKRMRKRRPALYILVSGILSMQVYSTFLKEVPKIEEKIVIKEVPVDKGYNILAEEMRDFTGQLENVANSLSLAVDKLEMQEMPGLKVRLEETIGSIRQFNRNYENLKENGIDVRHYLELGHCQGKASPFRTSF